MNRHSLPTIRFTALHRKVLYAVFASLWISGALWLVLHYFFQSVGDFGARANPLEIWCLRLHGLVVFAVLIAIGSVLPVHAKLAWRINRNRRSGLAMKLFFLWMMGTGYALYYFASEDTQDLLALLHWAVGLAMPLLIGLHAQLGRRRLSTALPSEGVDRAQAVGTASSASGALGQSSAE